MIETLKGFFLHIVYWILSTKELNYWSTQDIFEQQNVQVVEACSALKSYLQYL